MGTNEYKETFEEKYKKASKHADELYTKVFELEGRVEDLKWERDHYKYLYEELCKKYNITPKEQI